MSSLTKKAFEAAKVQEVLSRQNAPSFVDTSCEQRSRSGPQTSSVSVRPQMADSTTTVNGGVHSMRAFIASHVVKRGRGVGAMVDGAKVEPNLVGPTVEGATVAGLLVTGLLVGSKVGSLVGAALGAEVGAEVGSPVG